MIARFQATFEDSQTLPDGSVYTFDRDVFVDVELPPEAA